MAGSIFGAVASPLIGGAVSSIFGGGSSSSGTAGAQTAAAAADPFASQRPQYQQQLQQLMTNPSSYTQSPAAQSAIQAGTGQTSATMASRGLTNSGAEQQALTKYATDVSQNDYYTQISNLMAMSGAGSGAPGQAGDILAKNSNANTQAINTFGGTVGDAVVNGVSNGNFFGNGGNTNMTGFQGNSPGLPGSGVNTQSSGLGSGTFDTSGGGLTLFTGGF